MTRPLTAALAVLAAAFMSLTTGCGAQAPTPSPSVSTRVSSAPTAASVTPSVTPTASPTAPRLAKRPKTQRGEVARSVVRSTPGPPSTSSIAGPDDVAGHEQQLSGACVSAEGTALTYRVLDASADTKGTVADRTLATGKLVCDGRVHQEGLDLGRTDTVQLTVIDGLDTEVRGWLIIVNR